MSLWSRIGNIFRGERLTRDIDEELQSHIDEAIEHGRDPAEVRRAFGSPVRMREESRDIRLATLLDSLRADVVFGWRQLKKHRTASAASIVSLALAIGAATAAFRLVDAVLRRPLPVAEPERLYFVATTYFDRDGRPDYRDDFDYPTFRHYRELIADRAEPMVVGAVNRREEVRFGEGAETERLHRQYLSGNVFPSFGLKPELGRLLMPSDDVTAGAHPVAVLSYDYWTRRFARDPGVIGRTFLLGKYRVEIVGVAPRGFIGTEPGEMVDLFVPAMMNAEAINSPGWSWFRMWVRLKPGMTPEQVRQPLEAAHIQNLRDNLKHFASDTPQAELERHLNQKLILFSAASGASRLQKEYQRPLLILGLLVSLVLLIACANVANLQTAQAAARAREMALRVSIGAGRARLMRLVLIECSMIAAFASALGGVFGAWSAPQVVSMLRMPEDPVRLVLETGWRELAFSFALALLVTLLFGLAGALRAAAVQPVHALKGGDDSGAPRRMKLLLSAQVAFCVTVLFVAGLFLATFHRLSTRPLGFTSDNVLVMDVSAQGELPPEAWFQAGDELRGAPGVLSVAVSGWPLLSGNRWSRAVRLPGQPADAQSPYMLDVSPNYFSTMGIPVIAGRDFRPGDRQPDLKPPAEPVAGVGIVNEAFARTYFRGENPVGRTVQLLRRGDLGAPMQIVGLVRNAVYYDLREPLRPTVYVPLQNRAHATVLVRTAVDPQSLASTVRQEISRVRPALTVVQIQPHANFIRWRLMRERLLATLSLFFAVVALVLASVGLYGVLNYSVTRRCREIGIRMALGARAVHVVRLVTSDGALVVCLGSFVGLAAGVMAGRLVEAMLYEVRSTGLDTLAAPILTLAVVALIASLPPAFRASRLDPARTLRNE